MSSLPTAATSISFRPQSATSSVVDVIASYRRAQAFLTDSVSASASAPSDEEDIDEEPQGDEEGGIGIETDRRSARDAYGFSNLEWDEDLSPIPERDGSPSSLSVISDQDRSTPIAAIPPAGESTPLLRKPTVRTSITHLNKAAKTGTIPAVANDGVPITLVRQTSRLSAQNKIIAENAHGKAVPGHSTFGQTLFNAIAILVGIGMLSEPLAFSYAGWIGGTMIIVSYGLVTCYTAKILAHIILDDLRLKSYSDIGHKAFGPRSGPLINALFCLELFAVGVALVTLFADSLYAVWPAYSPNTYKIFCLVFLIPTVFLPLSVLSYASMLGILSTLLIIVVILIDGFSKRDPPGSLWIPADTSLKFMGIGKLGVSFGLFMAGFSGHAVIPSLARDMVDPSRFDLMINYAFGIATAVYAIIGIAGYLMFGNSVSDEFSQDLAKYSVYPVLNKVALWGLVLTPISKYALSTRPLNITMEIVLGLETNTAPTSEHTAKSTTQGAEPLTAQRRKVVLKRILTAAERAAFTMLSVAVSILVPEFSSMMAFLGACTSFLLCVIGPISAKVALAGRCGFWDGLALVIGTVMAVWGTAATVWSST